MLIPIDKKWLLSSDDRNFILGYNIKTKKGETFSAQHYFGELSSAFRCYLKIKTRQSDATSFKELTDDIEKAVRSVGVCVDCLVEKGIMNRIEL